LLTIAYGSLMKMITGWSEHGARYRLCALCAV